MKKEKGLVEEHGGWDGVYREMPVKDLPWNAGEADPDLVRIVESGLIAAGRAVDMGTGPGHDAAYLANKGFEVIGVDGSPAAIALAKETAARAGAEVELLVGDVRAFSGDKGAFSFINDRGCLHCLPPGDWPAYVRLLHGLLGAGGHLFLRTFSEKVPPGPGPYRFTRRELEELLGSRFEFVEFMEGVFAGPRKPEAYVMLLKKKLD